MLQYFTEYITTSIANSHTRSYVLIYALCVDQDSFGLYHLLFYVDCMCQKSVNFTGVFHGYKQKM